MPSLYSLWRAIRQWPSALFKDSLAYFSIFHFLPLRVIKCSFQPPLHVLQRLAPQADQPPQCLAMRLLLPLLVIFALVLADVEVLSTNLRGWEACTRDERARISVGWEGAIKMAAGVKYNIDFNEEAAVEFFSPPPYSDRHADNVCKVFEFTSTFGQGSIWYPSPYKWQVSVRCDD